MTVLETSRTHRRRFLLVWIPPEVTFVAPRVFFSNSREKSREMARNREKSRDFRNELISRNFPSLRCSDTTGVLGSSTGRVAVALIAPRSALSCTARFSQINFSRNLAISRGFSRDFRRFSKLDFTKLVHDFFFLFTGNPSYITKDY